MFEKVVVGSTLLICGLLSAPFAAAQEFSAVYVEDGGTRAKMYVSKEKVRLESSTAGELSVVIYNLAQNTAYSLQPDKKTYADMSNSGLMSSTRAFLPYLDAENPCAGYMEMTRTSKRRRESDEQVRERNKEITYSCKTSAGGESINGRTTERWKLTATVGGETRTLAYLWAEPKLHLVMRIQGQGVGASDHTFIFENIQEGRQPASFFEVPADYRQIGGMPGAAPKNR